MSANNSDAWRRLRQNFCSQVGTFAIAVLCFGCAQVELPNLTQASEKSIPPYRVYPQVLDGYADDSFALAGDRSGSSYVEFKPLGDYRLLEVFANRPTCSEQECRVCHSQVKARTKLLRSSSPRIPLSVLREIPGLTILSYDKEFKSREATISLCDAGGFKLARDSVSWADTKRFLQGENSLIEANLLYVAPRYALPGDTISVTILSQAGVDYEVQSYDVRQTIATVDGGGWVYIATPAAASLLPTSAGGSERPSINDIDAVAFRVRVWFPDRPLELQPSLQDIGRCLAFATWDDYDANPRPKACEEVGVGNGVRRVARTQNQRIRYQVSVSQKWTLVLEDGRIVQQDYLPEQRAIEAIDAAYRSATGNELKDRLGRYVTIDPSVRVVPRVPLYVATSDPVGLANLKGMRLAPGDTVHVTLPAPRRQ